MEADYTYPLVFMSIEDTELLTQYETAIRGYTDRKRAEWILNGGIEEEWNAYLEKQEYQDLLAFYAPYLEKKNYFCITSSKKNDFSWGSLNPKRVVQPLLLEAEQITSEKKEEVEKQWDLYNKWLSATLNKKLMLIELGEGFLIPNLIRWPFEKVTFINQKSVLYRINGQLPQLPENISERAAAVSESSYDFLQELKKILAQ